LKEEKKKNTPQNSIFFIIKALRQLESLFNLSQLLFGLSRAETVNYTFKDLQLRKCPRSFKKSGFRKLQSGRYIIFYVLI
jgi:hypothetical protein